MVLKAKVEVKLIDNCLILHTPALEISGIQSEGFLLDSYPAPNTAPRQSRRESIYFCK